MSKTARQNAFSLTVKRVCCVSSSSSSSAAVRTPETAKIFADYRAALPNDFNVVQEGGWYAVEVKAVADVGRPKLEAYKENLPTDFDVEATAGGWTVLEQIAAVGPKELLVQYMTDMTQSGETAAATNADVLDAITALLHAQGKGFDANLVGKYIIMFCYRQSLMEWDGVH